MATGTPTKSAPQKDFATPSEEHSAEFDRIASEIITDDEPEAEEPFEVGDSGHTPTPSEDEGGEPEPQEAPEAQETTSEIDEEALGEAYDSFRRDGLSDEEIEARLKDRGYKRFLSDAKRRAKKHAADDEAYAEIRRLRATEQSERGNTKPSEKGERPQAGTPTLNLKDVTAPLKEQLALDDEGHKTLVASLEAISQANGETVSVLEERLGLVSNVLSEILQEGVMKEIGLDQLDLEDRGKIQDHYHQLLGTNLHGELSGKHRMAALMKSAAKLAGVKVPTPEEIQRKASIASAKRKGVPVVARSRALPKEPLSHDEIFDHVAKLVTSGAFKSNEEARQYADRLRAQTKRRR